MGGLAGRDRSWKKMYKMSELDLGRCKNIESLQVVGVPGGGVRSQQEMPGLNSSTSKY